MLSVTARGTTGGRRCHGSSSGDFCGHDIHVFEVEISVHVLELWHRTHQDGVAEQRVLRVFAWGLVSNDCTGTVHAHRQPGFPRKILEESFARPFRGSESLRAVGRWWI